MMQLVVPLLVAFYLVTSAAPAFAECAWVLWELQHYYSKAGVHVRSAWVLDQAFGTEERCRARLRSIPTLDASPDEQAAGIAKVSTRNVCLPDTVDPRRPKTR